MALDSLRFAHRFDQISGSAIREIFKMIAKPGMISFAGGNPAIGFLMRWLKTSSFAVFAIYRVLLGIYLFYVF